MWPTTIKFPQMDGMEDQMILKRVAVDDEGGTEPQDNKRSRKAKSPVGGVEVIVPETPTPEQIAGEAKREEYARASGQMTGNGISSVHKQICVRAAETFGKIRQLLVERTVDTLNEAFLDPL